MAQWCEHSPSASVARGSNPALGVVCELSFNCLSFIINLSKTKNAIFPFLSASSNCGRCSSFFFRVSRERSFLM